MKNKLNKIKVSVITTILTVLSNVNTVLADTPAAKKTAASDIVKNIDTATDTVFKIIAAIGALFFGIGIITAVRGNSKGMDDKVDKGISLAIAGMVMASIEIVVGMFK